MVIIDSDSSVASYGDSWTVVSRTATGYDAAVTVVVCCNPLTVTGTDPSSGSARLGPDAGVDCLCLSVYGASSRSTDSLGESAEPGPGTGNPSAESGEPAPSCIVVASGCCSASGPEAPTRSVGSDASPGRR